MFSQGTVDEMSVEELVKTIRSLAYSIENHISDDPEDALDYCYALNNIANSLRERIEGYLSDDE